MRGLIPTHVQLTEKVLDLRLQRQNIVTGNIVNVNTPDYKARRLDFEEKLQQALNQDARGKMTRTNSQHMPVVFDSNGFSGDASEAFKARTVYGEDSVDLDKEMTIMAKNSMTYDALASVIRKNFEGLRQAITEGGR